MDIDLKKIGETIFYNGDNYYNYLLFLFADLYLLSKNILSTIEKDDFIILIGDTPSYLSFFFKNQPHYILPFSNKPFGLFYPPYAEYLKKWECLDVFLPTEEQLLTYFNYLDKNTIITKKFIKEKWNNIVLIDTSSGASIHGVSIFFNLYVGNLKLKINNKCKGELKLLDIKDIDNAKPLQFINIMNGSLKSYNVDIDIIKKLYPKKLYPEDNSDIINYNPKLIIQISCKHFLYRHFFIIEELFPRLVPFYHKDLWTKPPEIIISDEIKEIKRIYNILLKGLKEKNLTKEKNKYYMDIVKELSKNIKNKKMFLTNNYKDTMYNIFNMMLNLIYL